LEEFKPINDEEDLDTLMAKITKAKKKGKLTKGEDEETVNVEKETYYKLYSKMGGFKLFIPFIASVGILEALEL
jgi:hypothetical protein